MKLLTRLRELRTHEPLEQFFDGFHYAVDGYCGEAMGIGSTTHDDIIRLNNESLNFEKNDLKLHCR
jgi:hypothetical protein